MGYEINLVPETERYEYVKSNFDFKKLIYMADGDADVKILKEALILLSQEVNLILIIYLI